MREAATNGGKGSLSRAARAAGTLFLYAGGAFVHPGVRVGHRAVLRGVAGAAAGGSVADAIDAGASVAEAGGRGALGDENATVVLETLSLSPLVFSIDGPCWFFFFSSFPRA